MSINLTAAERDYINKITVKGKDKGRIMSAEEAFKIYSPDQEWHKGKFESWEISLGEKPINYEV